MIVPLNMFYGVPTLNGNKYPREILEPQFKEKIAEHLLFVLPLESFYKLDSGSTLSLINVAAVVHSIEEEDENLFLNIEINNNDAGALLSKALDEENIEFSIAGCGEVNKQDEVYDYVLSCIIYCKK